MARFIYKAKSGPNDLKEGVIEAETKRSAIYKISQMGYFPLDVEEQFRGAIVPIFSIKNRITARDILLFTRQMADLLSSGLTLVASLNVLCRQTEKP
ncbi:MAG: type II secretion system protein F, partial [Candidatus Omnitrophica bacterium CG_4_8_14_3_um_filter_43_15]